MELIERSGSSPYARPDRPPNCPMAASVRSRSPRRWRSIPTVLLLDEPMAGMGHEDIGRISDLIRAIAKDRTVLMVEHNLNVVADLCDRVTVLARGEILADGTTTRSAHDPRVREAYMGTEHE